MMTTSSFFTALNISPPHSTRGGGQMALVTPAVYTKHYLPSGLLINLPQKKGPVKRGDIRPVGIFQSAVEIRHPKAIFVGSGVLVQLNSAKCIVHVLRKTGERAKLYGADIQVPPDNLNVDNLNVNVAKENATRLLEWFSLDPYPLTPEKELNNKLLKHHNRTMRGIRREMKASQPQEWAFYLAVRKFLESFQK